MQMFNDSDPNIKQNPNNLFVTVFIHDRDLVLTNNILKASKEAPVHYDKMILFGHSRLPAP
jgi:hypothetical protein